MVDLGTICNGVGLSFALSMLQLFTPKKKQVKALIRWSRAGFLSSFHCCKLRCKILQIIADKKEKGLQFYSFHIAAKQEAYGKEEKKFKGL